MKQTAVNTLLNRQVDGIIYATMYHREVHPPENIREVPTVLLDCFVADSSLPSVVPDEVEGGKQATAYLCQQGHQRIGFICNEDDVPAKHGRLQGYKTALAENNIPFNPKLVKMGPSDQQGGYDSAMTLLQQENRPTALFCYNDLMAMGAYDAIRKLNLAIPEDIAIIGYDNQALIAAHLYPPLTTMQLPHYEMGQWAVNQLLTLVEQAAEDASPLASQFKLSCPMVKRLSA